MARQPYPTPGSCVAKNSQRPASVQTVQGVVPPYGVKETLMVNGKWWYISDGAGALSVMIGISVPFSSLKPNSSAGQRIDRRARHAAHL